MSGLEIIALAIAVLFALGVVWGISESITRRAREQNEILKGVRSVHVRENGQWVKVWPRDTGSTESQRLKGKE